ncbi:uncharacterized protein [Clytia hemisphaerica]|uniref:uncharacterized protein n=1 Tax=Clytia hemisphaerica TaxID=252671 RepID=UPI0034D5BDCF
MDEIDSLEKENKLKKNDGPLVQNLDDTLKQLHVHRSSFHGRSFVGNHVNTLLKDKSLVKLCNSIPILVHKMGFAGTYLHRESIEIAEHFKLLFKKYAVCHNYMNSSDYFSDEKIGKLDEAIKDLMTYYRTGFPEETITPKLHMLEHHVLDFIKRWRIGLGMSAEQGAESIHPEFNALIKRFALTRNEFAVFLSFSVLEENFTIWVPDNKEAYLLKRETPRSMVAD